MAQIFTSTTESEQQMRADLGVAAATEAEDTPVASVSLTREGEESADAPQQAADDKPAPAAVASEDEEISELPGRAQKAIGKYRRKLGDAERTIQSLSQRLSAIEARQAAPPQTEAPKQETASVTPAGEDREPLLNDPDVADYDDWIKRHDDWTKRQTKQEILRDLERREADRAAAQSRAEAERAFTERLEAVRAAHPDFDEVVPNAKTGLAPEQLAQFNAHLSRQLVASKDASGLPLGPDIQYHLATHQDDLDALVRCQTLDTFLRTYGRIEARVEMARAGATPAAPAPVRTSRAPAPLRGVTGASPTPPSQDSMTYKELEQQWAAEARQKGYRVRG